MATSDADKRLAEVMRARENADTRFLERALSDPENRHLAARFLGEMGATETAPKIEPLLYANDPLARSNAARALGLLHAADALERVAELAERDPEPFVRGAAVTALGRIGRRAAVPALIGYLYDREWRVRVGAAFALGLIGDAKAAAAVRDARKREGVIHPFRRRALTRALRALEQPAPE